MRVALNSWGPIATGLGSEARWLWKLLPFGLWIQARHPRLGLGPAVNGERLVTQDWPRHLPSADCVVAIERFVPEQVVYEGERRKVLLANPEWSAPDAGWIARMDVVVARTQLCQRHMMALHPNVVRRQPVLDLDEFPYRQRHQARVAVFTAGWGGVHDRKGTPEVRRMLAVAPDCVRVYSQKPTMGIFSFGAVESPAQLYEAADIVVMPSRFEGVGLTALEALASGCLLLATDAEPMSEWVRAAYGADAEMFLLPVAKTEIVIVAGQPWWSHLIDPRAAVERLRAVQDLPEASVRELSARGRAYVEREHGADAARLLWETIIG